MSSGRANLREFLELKADGVFDLPAGTSLNVPVELSAGGNFHAFYFYSVVPDASSGFVGVSHAVGSDVQWTERTLVIDGQRLDYLHLDNTSLFSARVRVRIYRVRGLADT